VVHTCNPSYAGRIAVQEQTGKKLMRPSSHQQPQQKPGMMVHAYNPRKVGGIDWKLYLYQFEQKTQDPF
jgi:hypothetical protein